MAKKIMVIDDDPNIVTYLTELFQDNSYEVCSSPDGNGAMEIVKRERPDLVTLDIEMPDEMGPKFFRELSGDKTFKNIPVIVISGVADAKYVVPKADAVVHKPFDREKLLKLVKDMIG
ncbi:MAG: response regulator [Pseudomonadota bacterium]